MENNNLFTDLEKMTLMCQQMAEKLTMITSEYKEVIDNLEMENQHLRERLADLEAIQEGELAEQTEVLSRSRKNLEKLYDEGFHVCQSNYGARRDGPCMFCTNVIYDNE